MAHANGISIQTQIPHLGENAFVQTVELQLPNVVCHNMKPSRDFPSKMIS